MPTLSILFGHAMADALGVPVEFQTREQLQANPVTGCVDYHDVMERFCNWMNNAQYTATGVFFDIGITTRNALNRYLQGQKPLDCGFCGDYDNGNGSLIHDFSSLTHAHPRSQMGSASIFLCFGDCWTTQHIMA